MNPYCWFTYYQFPAIVGYIPIISLQLILKSLFTSMCHDKCIIFCSLNHVEHHLCLFWAIFYYNIPLPLVVTIQRSYGKTPFLSSVNYNVYLIHVGHLYHSYLQKFHDLSHIFPVCPLFIPYIATIQNNDSTQAVASSTTLQASTSC